MMDEITQAIIEARRAEALRRVEFVARPVLDIIPPSMYGMTWREELEERRRYRRLSRHKRAWLDRRDHARAPLETRQDRADWIAAYEHDLVRLMRLGSWSGRREE